MACGLSGVGDNYTMKRVTTAHEPVDPGEVTESMWLYFMIIINE